ncbi:hypothetical protein KW798_01690, partial [Candidatus Parcubacteria bacterium]|nr:hypothetical protein [Candidatus Parcubacteria bacterium]
VSSYNFESARLHLASMLYARAAFILTDEPGLTSRPLINSIPGETSEPEMVFQGNLDQNLHLHITPTGNTATFLKWETSGYVKGEVPGSTVFISADDTTVAVGSSTGAYTFQIDLVQNGTDHIIDITGKNSSASSVYSYVVEPTQVKLNIDSNGDGSTDRTTVINGSTVSDTIAPITVANVTGPAGTNGWYLGNTSVALSATDNAGGVGVDKTYYSLDGGVQQVYINPIAVTAEGTHTLMYYSVDFFGNTEAIKTQTIKIDLTAPEAVVSASLSLKDVQVVGTDAQGAVTVTKDANNVYILTDQAGHTTKLTFSKTFNGKIVTLARMTSIKYDSTATTTLPSSFGYAWDTTQILVSQTVVADNQFAVQAIYDKVKNKTGILVLKKNVPFQTFSVNGLAVVKLSTNTGTVSYSW